MSDYGDAAWQHLARAVRLRIDRHLGMKDKQIAERAGISAETLSKIVNARARRYSGATLASLARALEWREDVPYLILEGQLDAEDALHGLPARNTSAMRREGATDVNGDQAAGYDAIIANLSPETRRAIDDLIEADQRRKHG